MHMQECLCLRRNCDFLDVPWKPFVKVVAPILEEGRRLPVAKELASQAVQSVVLWSCLSMASVVRRLGVVRAFAKHLARWKSRISYACAGG